MAIHSFNISHKFLDNINVPRLDFYDSNVVLKDVDFIKAKDAGNIEFRKDGVYLKHRGNWIRGYYYMNSYKIKEFGNPRFHLFNCQTMKQKSMFIGDYHWSNADSVKVLERANHQWKEDLVLPLCSFCSKMLNENISDTEEFFDSNDSVEFYDEDKTTNIIPDNQHNIYGYPINWKEIASAFKDQHGLKCDDCGFKLNDKHKAFYFDVDHVNGYDKNDCSNDNLQILCKLCHTYKDKHHLKQAKLYPYRSETLHELVRNYENQLLKINNPYLSLYFENFKNFLKG
ncbi:HNH endonuclease signature motif containing protein [Formosa sp. PL04]|uniref:HNH endonuclease signature motif containing protein n=1 Tax=Formosa sp. PL04 TaxID=3081755 RepID=UPI00298159E9|nr:HNH endonuclease signature motif containing protein [Formosa sp. PL04]MDW5289455.1 HNH endonuclease signature motif containing protein [Formosa sp. PL04]